MKLVIVGAGGRLGTALAREYREKFSVIGFDHTQLDLANANELREKLCTIDFDLLINAAAFANVDLCEKERDQAFRINADAPRILAEICRDKNARLIHFSTDYVFDGGKREPYVENDSANPISVYGESKLAGEQNVLALQDRHLVVRVSWIFGPDRPSFIDGMIKRAQENDEVDAVADKFSAPTYTDDIAEMLVVATIGDPGGNVLAAVGDRTQPGVPDPGYNAASDYNGILHFTSAGECSWQEYAQWALDCCQEIGLLLKGKTVGA